MTRTLGFRASAQVGALILVLGACTSVSPEPSPPAPSAGTPGGSPGASPQATNGSPDPGSVPPEGGEVAEGAIVQVVADTLRVRAEPSTGAELAGTLVRGAAVRVVSGPVDADGFRWFEIVDTTGQAGWAADGDGTDPWLSPLPDLSGTTPILTLSYICDVVGPFPAPATVVFDNGLVLLTDPVTGNAWAVRRLSDAGLTEIRDNVIANQYLQQSAEYRPQPRPDAGDPPGHGACAYTFEIEREGEPIVVTSIGWFGDQEESTFYQPSPERKALDGLARGLIDIESVLADDLWADAAALPYVAAEYLLFVAEGVGPPIESAPPVDPAAIGIPDPGSFGSESGGGRCDVIPREQAFEIVRILLEATGEGTGFEIRLSAPSFMGIVIDDGWLDLVLAPQTPDGLPSCENANR